MTASERKQFILSLLEEHSAVSVSRLSEALQLSETFIRRILNEMENEGLLKRTWGGAASLSGSQKELEHDTKAKKHVNEKKSIAIKALELIKDGDAVFLDSGSTNLELANVIASQQWNKLTIATNALNIACKLVNLPGITLLMIGGEVRGNALSCVGPIAESTLKSIVFDKGFISTYKLSVDRGITTPNIYEAHFKQCVMQVCKENITLADHSKFGDDSMGLICSLSGLDYIVSDWLLDPAIAAQVREVNENLIIAEKIAAE